MYTVKKVDENVIEIKEQILSFTDTKTTFFYYDIENWKRSITGKESEIPSQSMLKSEIDWVKKHYLPKL